MTDPEIRSDPLTGQRVIIAPKRAERPGALFTVAPLTEIDQAKDPFAEGNEHLTPPEVFADRPADSQPDTPGWQTRVVPNLYPSLLAEPAVPEQPVDPDLFYVRSARGAHEVIINSPRSVRTLGELDTVELAAAVNCWQNRISAQAASAYTHLIINERPEAGASLAHTHAQLFAFDFVPTVVAHIRERFSAYATQTLGGNLLANLVQEEVRLQERVIEIDQDTVLLTPYASQAPYQMMIVPRVPKPDFTQSGDQVVALLAFALERLKDIFGESPPLNIWVRTRPQGVDTFCWYLEILPRLTIPAGLELGAGLTVNIIAPEQAAKALRR